MQNLLKQTGAAIIVALFVTSLVAIAAIAMVGRLTLDIHRTELIVNATQANGYAQGSIDWAIDQLNKNLQESQPNKRVDATPIHSPLKEMNGMTISSTIYDAEGRFNINNLADTKNQVDFVKLILAVAPQINSSAAQTIAMAVTEWVSTANTANKPLTTYYEKLKPPYRAPHHLMVSVSELRLVKGITPELFAALAHYVTALPETTPVNVNSASAEVLMSINPTMTLQTAQTLAHLCHTTPFVNMQDFLNTDSVKKNAFPGNKITLLSRYFLLRTNVKVGQQNLTLYTLLQRKSDNKQAHEVVLWQSRGTL